MRTLTNIIAYALLTILISCKQSLEPIDYGRDACAHCKMTIVDKKFAAELLTEKGRTYKFDDVHCMKQYIKEHGETGPKVSCFVASYDGVSAGFLKANEAIFLQSEFFSSPMNGHYAAFASSEKARHLSDSLKIDVLSWDKVD